MLLLSDCKPRRRYFRVSTCRCFILAAIFCAFRVDLSMMMAHLYFVVFGIALATIVSSHSFGKH
ncbi:hypothetical protein F5050DRAFT_1776626 [Lentinula boryana]|uniref:Uncharacterized protein n=1 Tax=Lentinula boryana TaxID=40481 RepID=A0ABQ8Q6L0_9AGAR|nr:hypothetical protein F5050DRAFT_1776626 [Lentinula boryana]